MKMEMLKSDNIQNKIFTVRGVQVMLDSDLSILFGTETKFINRAVKRNPLRFPEAFMFQLKSNEWADLKYQIGTSSDHGGRRTLPFVFSEQGVAMLSAVLNSESAVIASIQIIQAFIVMRKFLQNNAAIFQRLNQVELKQLKTDEKLEQVFKALEAGKPEPQQGIFFDGQIFDAYVFVADIIKKAKSEIILLDNYVDETVLTLFAKRPKKVSVTIFTKAIHKPLQLDAEKYNSQYQSITIKTFSYSHDRFLIIDGKELYHLGASLKDLGKKWFAFSRMDSLVEEVLKKLIIDTS